MDGDRVETGVQISAFVRSYVSCDGSRPYLHDTYTLYCLCHTRPTHRHEIAYAAPTFLSAKPEFTVTHLTPRRCCVILPREMRRRSSLAQNWMRKADKKLGCRRRTSRRAVLVKILSTVQTRCTTNAQPVAVVELEGCSWSTGSKQSRLVDCCIKR